MADWLVTGATGMLGADLVRELTDRGERVTACSHRDLDVTDAGAVEAAVAGHDVVVNTAAWTDVDAAEDQPQRAHTVNALGPANLAVACLRSHARLVQISTDYVFDGTAAAPYEESATTCPVNVYGQTKRDGELAVRQTMPRDWYVVRTSWLYGEHGRSFPATMARLARERDTVNVVDDQVGQPTWTSDLAAQIVMLATSDADAGTYHATNTGQTSWYGLARAVFAMIGLDPDRVRPVPSTAFPRPARRPAYSVLGQRGWARAGLTPMRPWEEALQAAAPTLFGQVPSSSA